MKKIKFFIFISLISIGFCVINTYEDSYSIVNDLITEFESISMPAIDIQALLNEDEQNQGSGIPLRFGYAFDVNYGINNSGTWENFEDGSRLWKIGFKSEGAYGMKVLFDSYNLPQGALLYMYSSNFEMSRGPYTYEQNHEDGSFAIPLVKSDHIIIEYFQPAYITETPEININKVIHAYRDIHNYYDQRDDRNCGDNVACSNANDFEEQVNSVIYLEMYTSICSASLVNNTSEDLAPYVLTAWHCVEGDGSLGSHNNFTFYFNHQSSTCSGSNGNYSDDITGSTILSWGSMNTSDFALLEMDNAPGWWWTPQPYYAGWSRYTSSPTISTGIHHPSGEPKKINFDNDQAYSCSWYSASTHWCLSWDDGGTAPGSSGSPIFDNNKRIVGQLTGGSGECGTGTDYYGKISRSWNNGSSASSRLKDWLDPLNTNQYTLDGTYDGLEVVEGCTDDDACNYNSDANTDDGSCDYGITCWDGSVECNVNDCPDNSSAVTLSFGQQYAGSFEIIIDTPEEIGGFQFNVNDNPNDITITGASGGMAEESGFTVSTNENGTILGFSFTGGYIPVGQHVLTNISYSGGSNGPELCLSDVVISDVVAEPLYPQTGDCVSLSGSALLSFGSSGSGYLEIFMSNSVPVAGFQFDIIDSPDDIILTNANGGIASELGWTVSTSESGTVLGFSFDGVTIPASDGDVLLTSISIAGDGNPEVCIENGVVSNAGGQGLSVLYGDCATAILSEPGDLNYDGIVNVLDIITLVNIVLGDSTDLSGDLNSDGIVNVLDIITLVNLVLG